MLYNYNEVLKKFGDRYELDRAIKNKDIYKVSRGVYSDKEYIDPMILISYKYKNIIITMDNAFYYYDLTDVIPTKTYIVTHNNDRKVHEVNVVQTFISDKLYSIGVTTININGIDVKMYDRERMLIELIRNKNSIAFDYYKEIINSYRDIVSELDIDKLNNYLKYFSNGKNIIKIIEREVL